MNGEINGYYGTSNPTACTVYIHDDWYVVDGSININRTSDILIDGVNVEYLNDYDMFTAREPITNHAELVTAIAE
jgi:hypothetical protein